uniref:Phasin family protein n=1 Tax=Candidatus Kentrum sp. TC TaxID=2126339 RepID=A0A450ZKI6_9GAMM|nr:MAG: phasin family protein [Candidatus Kentron sp. TC]VFK39715.1 MAG: phasin family protein [Candidatus Kentron sp. TC]VFK54267.1 MAG: phasin family protein [Candidatus Kentron sp. TC]
MVIRKDEAVSGEEAVDRMSIRETEAPSVKKAVSPLERWAMIAEAAYYRAQKRGFIGGNPMGDWIEAEREIDADYAIDYSKIMMPMNPSEIMEQFSKAFTGVVGQSDSGLSEALEKQRKNVEALADANKRVFGDIRDMMERQTGMFRRIMDQAISPMKGRAESASSKGAAQQAELIRLGLEKTLVSMRETAESIIKANTEALDAANQRMAESMSAFKQLAQKLNSGKS